MGSNERKVKTDDELAWRFYQPMPPLERFDTPENHVRPHRTALGKTLYEMHRGNRMAGSEIRPSFFEFTDWLRAESRTDPQRWYIAEFVTQMEPGEWRALATHSGATAYEIARAMIDAQIDRATPAGWVFPRLFDEPCPVRIRLAERRYAIPSMPIFQRGRDVTEELAATIV